MMRNVEAMPKGTSDHFVVPGQAAVDSRRRVLGLLAASPILVFGLSQKAKAAECMNPETISPGESDVRKELGFKLMSPDPAKQCAGCGFFTATEGDCGTCALMSGGAVTAHSVCDSWAAKG
jgi:hypothetical protein